MALGVRVLLGINADPLESFLKKIVQNSKEDKSERIQEIRAKTNRKANSDPFVQESNKSQKGILFQMSKLVVFLYTIDSGN